MTNQKPSAQGQFSNSFSWKTYNQIKKKAVEQKFSWSGLYISVSIAFFIVFATAQLLNLAYYAIEEPQSNEILSEEKIYQLENEDFTNGLGFSDLLIIKKV